MYTEIKSKDCINLINEKHRKFAMALYELTTEDYKIKGEFMLCFCCRHIKKVGDHLQLTNADKTITKIKIIE